MRLYRQGDGGEPVRDIQDRLLALGFSCEQDPRGSYGDGTTSAVQAFQKARALTPDGIVGPDTWRALVGAGYRLGDRLLYHRVPMTRGDDVADVQRRLNSLGFHAGKVDGIFGPDTLTGLLDFQSNRLLAEDGVAGPRVKAELDLMSRETAKHGKESIVERQWLLQLPPTLVGQQMYVDSFCRTPGEADRTWRAAVTLATIIQDLGATPILSRSVDTKPTQRVRALRANRLGVDMVVSFAVPETEQPSVLHFASAHSMSEAGAHLAGIVAHHLDLPVAGRSIPILKDTRSPAIVIVASDMGERTAGRTAQGLIDLVARKP